MWYRVKDGMAAHCYNSRHREITPLEIVPESSNAGNQKVNERILHSAERPTETSNAGEPASIAKLHH